MVVGLPAVLPQGTRLLTDACAASSLHCLAQLGVHFILSRHVMIASSALTGRPKRKSAIEASALISAELAQERVDSGADVLGAPRSSLSNRKRRRSPSTRHRDGSSSVSPAQHTEPPSTPSPASRKRQKHSQQSAAGAYTAGPVFDTCNEVRRKIRAFINKGGMTVSAFLRELGGINSNSYRQFMTMKVRNHLLHASSLLCLSLVCQLT